jgi:hypothetical protein
MIKLGFIVPPKSLSWTIPFFTTYHLILAHILEASEKYKSIYSRLAAKGDYITLDNSSFEMGDDIYSPSQLIDMALEVGATEVMAPETYLSSSDTKKKMMKFLKEFEPRRGILKVFGTVHGKTLHEVTECYKAFVDMGVDTIGFSCRLNCPDATSILPITYPTLKSSIIRASIIQQLRDDNVLDKSKRHHLLGLNHPLELCFYADLHDEIASCDSSAAYVNAYNLTEMSKCGAYQKPHHIDFNDPTPDSELIKNIFSRNVGFLTKLAQWGC